MSKKEARRILETYLSNGGIPPIFDCVVYRYTDHINGVQEDVTFRCLLCIIYDLKEI